MCEERLMRNEGACETDNTRQRDGYIQESSRKPETSLSNPVSILVNHAPSHLDVLDAVQDPVQSNEPSATRTEGPDDKPTQTTHHVNPTNFLNLGFLVFCTSCVKRIWCPGETMM